MTEERGIGGIYLERAAAEQLAEQLTSQGWEVEREGAAGNIRIDLVARRGGETVFYEFKLAGSPSREAWSRQLVAVQRLAREQGAQFRLILVRPPRQTELEVAGIERMLFERLVENPPWQVADIAGHTLIDDVEGVELSSVRISGTTAETRGDASLSVTLQTGSGEVVSSETFPFTFSATLDLAEGRATSVEVNDVDTSSWYGEDLDEDDGTEGADAAPEDSPDF